MDKHGLPLYSVREMNAPRQSTPHYVSVRAGRTWGDRMYDRKQARAPIDPNTYYINQFYYNANDLQARVRDQSGYLESDSKSYYMNDPEQQNLKPLLSELGRYEPPMVEGIANMHSQLSNDATRMYQRRIVHGMS